ncbi:ECF-type sigma factor [Roseiconus lacunae]|uniref:ECF-type sigma factor n=1 Tax=Roseiconus lacunae TaxID=2605694 RepID=A0ABT7PJC7_9BACT|nr:ECF-type sigma factor [Roseiconus lacunae]MCD0461748.1 RNA polymerase subunit sigma-70 [Roseiconus lacunae]MDM4016607.1 ECF-type sigma factor [Roseiconus lacunae]WRQ49475.1 ECF-type sigma factor [Stieleria sp. HD01]
MIRHDERMDEPFKNDSDLTRFRDALDRVRDGDDEAIAELWESYFQRLVRLAAKRLPANLKRAGDEEDVALSAFNSFIAGIRRDQFPDLSGPDNLWGLLITLTGRKVNAHLRYQTRQKRGGGAVRGESVFIDPDQQNRVAGIGAIAAGGKTADLAIELEEACDSLLEQLPDEQLRQIAVMRMDGFLVDEIADRLQISKRATERRLQLIRRIWSEQAESILGDRST